MRPDPVDKAWLQELYLEYLRDEGFRPTTDSDGDVTFKFEGGLYFIHVLEDDPTYFRLVYPRFWAIEDEAERDAALRAASLVSARKKGAKVFVEDDDTTASVELFLPNTEDFRRVFPRCLNVVQEATRAFRQRMIEWREGRDVRRDAN